MEGLALCLVLSGLLVVVPLLAVTFVLAVKERFEFEDQTRYRKFIPMDMLETGMI